MKLTLLFSGSFHACSIKMFWMLTEKFSSISNFPRLHLSPSRALLVGQFGLVIVNVMQEEEEEEEAERGGTTNSS